MNLFDFGNTSAGKHKCRVCFEPSGIEAEVEKGENLLQAALNAGVSINCLCDGCGICATCKVLIKSGEVEFKRTDKLSEAEYSEGYVQACQSRVSSDINVLVPAYQPGINIEAGVLPCRDACPAGVNVPLYNYLVSIGKYQEALAIIREKVPFPGVLGRVCTHPCEKDCQRGKLDAPVAIRALKRFIADRESGEWKQFARKLPPSGKKVAIVGSGPAGLTAGYYLAKLGHSITVFETTNKPGGMLRMGIPDFRLPKDVLDAEIDEIKQAGVEIELNSPVNSIDQLLEQGYEAVFLAMGAQLSKKLDIKGRELEGVLWGLDFLKLASLQQAPEIKSRVLVIGGGNVAVDVALTALRLGAEGVELLCLESKEEMPANEEEIRQLIDEGVRLDVSRAPYRVCGSNGRVTGLEVIRCISVFDEDGRFSPCYDNTEVELKEAGTVIFAVGQTSNLSDFPDELRNLETDTITADSNTLETSLPGVFAGGDIVTGPTSVIEAIAAGRKAAISIDKYLGGEGIIDEELTQEREIGMYTVTDSTRTQIPCLAVEQRKGNFNEVEMCLDEQSAITEAQRCFQCGVRLESTSQPLPPGFTF